MKHAEFEKKIMEMLLAGDDPVLQALRNQYHNSTPERMEFTGAGFYTMFKVSVDTPPLASRKSFEINDINASFGEIREAFGFIIFVREGYLSMLEGYTLASDVWPDDYSSVVPVYNGPRGNRDFEKLRKNWVS
jgi:hypothetical protein